MGNKIREKVNENGNAHISDGCFIALWTHLNCSDSNIRNYL